MITKTCPQCATAFSGPDFRMKRKIFCRHECYVTNRTKDLTDLTFGRLKVVEFVGNKRWKSICQCGNEAISKTQNLTSGKTRSCGCLSREIAANLKRTHGAYDTRAHNSWSGMIQRCTNPNTKQFSDYGGRGITVCERWMTFANFLADMGQPPKGNTIERRNNDLGYTPENCEWATRKKQQRNRRTIALFEPPTSE